MLKEASSFREVFQVVKSSVQEVLGIRRAGLELILMDLPGEIGAMHQIGSNAIIMNRKHLQALLRSSRSKLEVNSYIFYILLHEYIHSLGIPDEEEVKILSLRVIRETLGENHPAYRMASKKGFELADLLGHEGVGSIGEAELVKDFDTDNAQYIT